MSTNADEAGTGQGTRAEPETEPQVIDKDTNESPESEADTEALQDRDVSQSAALDDADIDENDVRALPGTGGPDDEGDVDVDPGELHL